MLLYVGLDVRKRFCYGTVMNEKGVTVKHGKFGKNRSKTISRFRLTGWLIIQGVITVGFASS